MLADEMGMGKTVDVIALLLLRPRPAEQCVTEVPLAFKARTLHGHRRSRRIKAKTASSTVVDTAVDEVESCCCRALGELCLLTLLAAVSCLQVDFNFDRLCVRATLLVCPHVIVAQWLSELATHAPSLRVFQYEGMVRSMLPFRTDACCDSIIGCTCVEPGWRDMGTHVCRRRCRRDDVRGPAERHPDFRVQATVSTAALQLVASHRG